MKKAMLVIAFALSAVAEAQSTRLYIPPQEGFEAYLAAAIVKKHVPVVVTQKQEDSQLVLASVTQDKKEDTAGKITRCLFLYCIGAFGDNYASVQLTKTGGDTVVWAYNVHRYGNNYQAIAQDIAKHLKKFLEEHPQ